MATYRHSAFAIIRACICPILVLHFATQSDCGRAIAQDAVVNAISKTPSVSEFLDYVAKGDGGGGGGGGGDIAGEDTAVRPLVFELCDIASDRKHPDHVLAIRSLAHLKARAAPAVPILCQNLYYEDYAVRNSAIASLVAIGESSIEPVSRLLGSASSPARASAIAVLSQLKPFSPSDLERYLLDPAPRGRAAAACALDGSNHVTLPLLARLVHDEEPAVGVCAVNSVKRNRSDPAEAVRILTAALHLPGVGHAAEGALCVYGIHARRAIPAIIVRHREDPVLPYDWWWGDMQGMEITGPPDLRDLAELQELLADSNPNVCRESVRAIRMLGKQAHSAAPAIRAAIHDTLAQCVKAKEESEDEYWELLEALSELHGTLWDVTGDVELVVRELRASSSALGEHREHGEHVELGMYSWGNELAPAEVSLCQRLLSDESAHIRTAGLERLRYFEDSGPLVPQILRIAKSDNVSEANLALRVLTETCPQSNRQVAEHLLQAYRDQKMPLDRFAEAVMQTKSAHAEIEQILNDAILQSDQNSKHTTVLCAQTLGRVTTAPQTLFRRLHDSYLNRYPYFRRHLSVRYLMMILRERNQHSDKILQFAVKQLPHNDFWTRHDAVAFIGEFGAAAKESLPQLRSYLSAERPEMRLAAAVAVYRVSGEIEPMNQLLGKDEFSAVDARYRPFAMSAIEELGSAGGPFLDYVLRGFDASGFTSRSIDVVDVLEAIGTARAQAKLMELAETWIWNTRVDAKAAVTRLEIRKAP
ncbi:hypothetical protein [Fuerstiella marisgermanici]|uniref:HEAT repeat n=1 Tax=Fuerstiella marisgermanici TaxID=1891926 RepID=A0A1P8WB66_9PLAN|nr:hypothetical protein [Fuerstiella marisgermanici]APZ91273.1 HEAT repeat [Fuerstiella marisgermanici]